MLAMSELIWDEDPFEEESVSEQRSKMILIMIHSSIFHNLFYNRKRSTKE